jgi:acetolactate synthase-1/2/3 large subunit
MICEPRDIPSALEEAFRTATTGRPGPVLLDIPMDVQRADIEPISFTKTAAAHSKLSSEAEKFLSDLGTALNSAKYPLVLAGGGIRSGRCTAVFVSVADRLGIPVVHSLMAVDVLPFSHPLRMGMIGTYGNRWSNIALSKSDLVIVLGSRLDVRQTGSDTDSFRSGKKFFHVDCEPGEMNNRVVGCHTLVAELSDFLHLAKHASMDRVDVADWIAEIRQVRSTWPDDGELPDNVGINPNTLMHQLSAVSGETSAFVIDVGQHQMWAAQSLRLKAGQRFLTSGGMGSMGFALPAALGVAIANPNVPCMVIAGDGGFQSNIQELETIRRYKLPIKMVIINNLCHGMVRQFQESYFDGRYQSTFWGYSAPDFERVAQAYGIPAKTCREPGEVSVAANWLMDDSKEPALLQVMVDTFANAYPKVAFGRPISEMEPFAKPIEMEST